MSAGGQRRSGVAGRLVARCWMGLGTCRTCAALRLLAGCVACKAHAAPPTQCKLSGLKQQTNAALGCC